MKSPREGQGIVDSGKPDRFSLPRKRCRRLGTTRAAGPSIPPPLQWFLFLFMLTAFCGSCAHRFRSYQTATRTEETASTWETRAESAVEQKRSEETKKSVKRVRETFRPDGTLLSRLTEQADSDGRVQVDTSASSSARATGQASKSVASSSSSSKASSTSWWPPWWLWLMGGLALLGGGWYLKRRYL